MSGQASAGAPARVPSHFRRLRSLWPVGVVAYLVAVFYAGLGDTLHALEAAELRWIAAMVGIELFALGLRAAKWRIALGPGNDSLAQCFISKAGGNLTPARIGELSPLLMQEFRTPRTGAWIVLDRCLEATATLAFGALGVVYLASEAVPGSIAVWAGAMAAMLWVGMVLLTRPVFSAWLRARLRPETRSDTLRPIARFICEAADEGVVLRGRTPLLTLITILATALDLCIGFALYRAFGFEISLLVLAVAQCAHAVTSAIPLSPNATGIPYAAAATVLNQAAGVPLEVLVAAIAVRLSIGNATFWSAFLVATRGVGDRSPFPDQGRLFDHLNSGEVLYRYDDAALETLRAIVGDPKRALDIGCGDGVIASALGGDIVGVDVSPGCARSAKTRGVPVVVADARGELPFAAERFDTVLCIDVLHHLNRDWDALLSKCVRLLRPGGRLIAIEPDARNPFVRWTQAPGSPIRVAPWPDEPAIYPEELEGSAHALGLETSIGPVTLEGEQSVRDVFPLWQRVLKAPWVIALGLLYRGRPNKFAMIATKPETPR